MVNWTLCKIILLSTLNLVVHYFSVMAHSDLDRYYGGVLKKFTHDVKSNDTDMQELAQFAFDYMKKQNTLLIPKDSNGFILTPELNDLKKIKLYYTVDGSKPFFVNAISVVNGQKKFQKRQIIQGITYTFTLSWPNIANSYHHRFTVTVDRNREPFIYQHTYYINPAGSNGVESVTGSCSADLPDCRLASQPTPVMATLTFDSGHNPSGDVVAAKSCSKQNSGSGHWDGKAPCLTGQPNSTSKNSGINIVCYNVWNLNSARKEEVRSMGEEHGYIERITQLTQLLLESHSDIIGFQEVRFTHGKGGGMGPAQISHITSLLPGYQFVFQPAMMYLDMNNPFIRDEEGLAVLSKFPISSSDYILLPRNESDSDDIHQRICLHVEIEVPKFGVLHVFVTHLSLTEESRKKSVVEIWKYMKQFEGPALLMGDFNAEPQSKEIMFLRGKLELEGISTENLRDAWLEFYPEPRPDISNTYASKEIRDAGLTFSTLNSHLSKRIDYIFLRLDRGIVLQKSSLLDDGKRQRKASSDHVGVRVSLSPSDMKI